MQSKAVRKKRLFVYGMRLMLSKWLRSDIPPLNIFNSNSERLPLLSFLIFLRKAIMDVYQSGALLKRNRVALPSSILIMYVVCSYYSIGDWSSVQKFTTVRKTLSMRSSQFYSSSHAIDYIFARFVLGKVSSISDNSFFVAVRSDLLVLALSLLM